MIIETAKVSYDIEIEYSFSGAQSEDTLLFVHGLGSNLRQFEMQQQYFAKNYRILLISLQGHGNSSTPINPTLNGYTIREMARDVQALLTHLGINKVHFVGNSMGGLVGYELLEMDEGLLSSLTTFGTTARLHSSRFTLWTLLTMLRFLGPKGIAWLVGISASKDKAVRARLKQMYEMVSKDTLELISMNIADYDYMDTICSHNIPMMLIRGWQDKWINKKLDPVLEIMGNKPYFELVEMPNAGHFANMEKPSDFNETLKRFLLKQSIRKYL
ncbi:MAG: Pimeloyl-ACP methyl ester carboxylesterase [Candidatus Methanomarinus sp.]|nr:MAG: Pimeloyl-ACP methyl ester carboxylesterase [ANME-2 cluster archaeon]